MQILNVQYVALIWYFVLQKGEDIRVKNFMDALGIQNVKEYEISARDNQKKLQSFSTHPVTTSKVLEILKQFHSSIIQIVETGWR